MDILAEGLVSERKDNREVKHNVNSRRQTANTTSDFEFYSSNS